MDSEPKLLRRHRRIGFVLRLALLAVVLVGGIGWILVRSHPAYGAFMLIGAPVVVLAYLVFLFVRV